MERTLAWLTRYRRLTIRHEGRVAMHGAFLHGAFLHGAYALI